MHKKDFAGRLNWTGEAPFQTLYRFVGCEVIETHGQRIRIREPAKLQDVADGLAPAEFA